MFLRQMTDAFLVRTEPDSSMVNPAHIHITSAPQRMKEKEFRTKPVSPSGDATAMGATTVNAIAVIPLNPIFKIRIRIALLAISAIRITPQVVFKQRYGL